MYKRQDLHSKKRSYLIYKVIAEIAPSDYDLKEWQDAVRYITAQMVSFEDSGQAAEYLLHHLKAWQQDSVLTITNDKFDIVRFFLCINLRSQS